MDEDDHGRGSVAYQDIADVGQKIAGVGKLACCFGICCSDADKIGHELQMEEAGTNQKLYSTGIKPTSMCGRKRACREDLDDQFLQQERDAARKDKDRTSCKSHVPTVAGDITNSLVAAGCNPCGGLRPCRCHPRRADRWSGWEKTLEGCGNWHSRKGRLVLSCILRSRLKQNSQLLVVSYK